MTDLERIHLLQAEREAHAGEVLMCENPETKTYRFVAYDEIPQLKEELDAINKRIAALQESLATIARDADANISALQSAVKILANNAGKGISYDWGGKEK